MQKIELQNLLKKKKKALKFRKWQSFVFARHNYTNECYKPKSFFRSWYEKSNPTCEMFQFWLKITYCHHNGMTHIKS